MPHDLQTQPVYEQTTEGGHAWATLDYEGSRPHMWIIGWKYWWNALIYMVFACTPLALVYVVGQLTEPGPQICLPFALYLLLGEGSMDTVADFYRSEREKGVNDYIFAPWALRIVAIQLSEDGRIDDAITMLTLNLETNPDDAASGEMLSDLRDRQVSKPATRQ